LAESPLGPKVDGRSEGYSFEAGKAAPYHGYFYQILTAQDPHAEGGAVTYLVNGKLYGGFGLVACPPTTATPG
jgi:hypothetical protein